jgi:hypothetical protein
MKEKFGMYRLSLVIVCLSFILTSCIARVEVIPGSSTPDSRVTNVTSINNLTVLPAQMTALIPTIEKTEPLPQVVTSTPLRTVDFTPTANAKPTSTTAATATMTPRPCPDPWFENPGLTTPPIFLLIFSGLYVAYSFDLPPDRNIFDLSLSPAQSFAASFSQNQQWIAYGLPNGRVPTTELWVSDVQLCNPIRFYADHSGPIGEWSDWNSYAYFQWGPGDKTLIFRSSKDEFPMVIYRLEDQEVEFWQGVCEDILYLAETVEVVIGCSHDGGYSYLHPDGRITTVISIPKGTSDHVVAWSFSREGDAAYITSAQEVYLLRRNGQKIKLPLKGYKFMLPSDPVPFQWAAERNRLLVLAYDPQKKRCPPESACWFVVDGDRGKITWWLKPEQIDKPRPWDEINMEHPASLSPDGELLALQYYELSLKHLLLIRLSTNEVLTEDDIFSDRMAWPYH